MANKPIIVICNVILRAWFVSSQASSRTNKNFHSQFGFVFILAHEQAIPWTNRIWPGLTEFGPPMWQTEADTKADDVCFASHGQWPKFC